jgi:tRNA pseudouridine55 synthase
LKSKSTKGRDINGILLLDKPIGYTSNQALQEVKRTLHARKAGHTGSLDPIATGLLPLCFGEATKVSQFLLDADKRYWAQFKLGQTTSTGDAEGEVLASSPVALDRARIEQALETFRGELEQIPPMYSAIKRNGQPLYKLARQGIEVEREPRRVTVYDLRLLDFKDGNLIELEMHCSRGFYVRSLAHDLGELLGCGAHVTALRRLAVAGFRVEDAVTLETLKALADDPAGLDALLVPIDGGLGHLPGVKLSRDAAYYLCRGQAVRAADAPSEGWVRLYTETAQFLGIGMVLRDGRVAPKRLFHGG